MKSNSSNKETPKIIALVVLGVAAVGIGVTQFILPQGASAGAPTPSPSASPAAGGDAASGAGTDTAVAEAALSGPVPVSQIQLQTNGRDPFVPSGSAAASLAGGPSSAPALPPPPQRIAPPYIPRVPQNGEIGKGFGAPPQSINDIVFNKNLGGGGGIRPVGEGTPALTVAPPTPPAYTVTGVVLGERGGRDVAILRGGGAGQEERRFVTVGEDVGSGFYVASIHANGITLRSRTHSSLGPVALDLGKTE